MNFAGILAGGIGSRMESSVPKQFLKIGDTPIVVRTLNTFLREACVDKVILAMNPQWEDYCKNMLTEYGVDMSRVEIIHGGTTRFLSMVNIVKKSMEILGDNLTADDMMLIHDCARPFVSSRIINDNFVIAKEYDMVTTSVPTIDTVLIAEDGKQSTVVPNRDTVFLDQGPQTFKIKEFYELFVTLTQAEIDAYMEAGRMYLEHNLSVGIVKGERTNFKITTEFDMLLGNMMIQDGQIK
ncbi:MAG: D-ribitol-5-phosphate cytidylyltransferase [Clostridia bacterium]|nr:D-ribitol-5-phosphate cytidylyltransferase [Clostridia bacterium]